MDANSCEIAWCVWYIFDHESDPEAEEVKPPAHPSRMQQWFLSGESTTRHLSFLAVIVHVKCK